MGLSAVRRDVVVVLVLALCVIGTGLTTATPAHAATDVGLVGPTYAGATKPTGEKPQSKLWIADGRWWGVLFDSASGDWHIFSFDMATNLWTDTGVLVDERIGANADVLWDGDKLYVGSAGDNAATVSHGPRLYRFSYNVTTQKWSKDSGFPVSITTGGVEAVVVSKDSAGLVWMTFTKNSKVMVAHSVSGSENVWPPPYQLPTPNGESNVTADDISTVLAYDGNKTGVMFSNQVDMVMYWAVHTDGTSDQDWALQKAYDQPEGADDHMNLHAVSGDPAGVVFGVAKTSMDKSNDPLINLLVLGHDGQWKATTVFTKGDNPTRATIQLDTANRQVYVFASDPCCSGGDIYYKQASLDLPSFPSGIGTLFMHSDANPKINNPTTTKQNVTPATGLLVLASDDSTRRYFHNRLDLTPVEPPPDTTPPDTTVVSGPPPTTTSTDVSFGFASSESGSSFACSLDGGPASSCTSPTLYGGLSVGQHSFTVIATDPSGNTDPTPATRSWTIEALSDVLFSEDFSSGGFEAGGWVVSTGADGTAAVEAGAVYAGDLGAHLAASTVTGSTASIRKNLSSANPTLSVSFDAQVVRDHSNQAFALLKIYNGAGTRVLTVSRNGSSDALEVQDSGSAVIAIGTAFPLSAVQGLEVRVETGGNVVVSLNGVTVWSTTTASLGTLGFQRVVLGDNSTRRSYDLRIDSVVLAR